MCKDHPKEDGLNLHIDLFKVVGKERENWHCLRKARRFCIDVVQRRN